MQLENICDVFSGYAFKSFNTEKEGTPIIKIGNINNDGTIDLHNCQYSTEEPNKKFKSKNGDIYIALSGATTGKLGLMKSDNYYINQRVGIVRIKDLKVPVDYLLFFLRSKTKKILSDAAGAAQPNISPKDIAKYEISIPNEEKMASISKELNLISRSIVLKRNKLLSLDELIKSRFIEMFKKYNKVELHTISKITMGQSPDSSSYNDEGNGTPFFQGKGDYGDKYTVVKHYTTSPKKIAKKDSVLMSVRAPVGPVNIANTDCCIGRGLCSIDAIEGQTNNEFIYNALNAMQDEISGKGNGSTFKAINKDDVYKLHIPSAPIDEQNDFSNFVKLIDKSKFIVQQEIKDLQELLDKKMDDYFGQ